MTEEVEEEMVGAVLSRQEEDIQSKIKGGVDAAVEVESAHEDRFLYRQRLS